MRISVNPGGAEGVTIPRFWAEGRERVVKYYNMLLCTVSILESGDF